MHKLSERMLMNVSLIPTGKNVADIGCDHGWVSVFLIQNNLANRVYAMDVAEGPLVGAREHIREAGLEDKIEVRLSDGFNELYYDSKGELEAKVALMAGIGGQLAVKLIRNNIDKCRDMDAIILQAQSELDYVRFSVYEMGFIIDAEKMVFEDGKYYTAMRLRPGESKETLSEAELRYGPVLIKDKPDILISFLEYKKESYQSILERISTNSNTDNGKSAAIISEISIIDSII